MIRKQDDCRNAGAAGQHTQVLGRQNRSGQPEQGEKDKEPKTPSKRGVFRTEFGHCPDSGNHCACDESERDVGAMHVTLPK